ncbi:MAG: DUF6056 family protein [Saccharofermentans sp.]|nr:DUF6056 family protein [Saccharofermentans sp.]
MKTFLGNKKVINAIIVILALVLLIVVIPIIAASFYSRPMADDFGYSHGVYSAVQNGGGLIDVLAASFTRVKEIYLDWQGTYAAVFFFTLQPGAFTDKTYFLTSIILLVSLISSTLFFAVSALKALGAKRESGAILALVILIIEISFVVDKYQAFFWWNGCSYYTLFYSIALVFLSLLIKMYNAEKKTVKYTCFAISIVLAALIGGGNYSTALVTSVLLFTGLVFVFVKKRKAFPLFLIVFVVLVLGFAVSMTAPGNSTRAASVSGTSALEAIVLSVMYAFVYIFKWTGLAQIAGFILIAMIALPAVNNTKFNFRYPLFVVLFSIMVFATQFTPPIYSMGYIGEGRQVNIFYYSYYLLVSFDIFYVCGWISKKGLLKNMSVNVKSKIALASLIVSGCLALGGCLIYGLNNITSIEITKALAEGIPQKYSAEYDERIASIKSGNTAISDIETIPDFFEKFCIESDSKYWVNVQMAEYFGVDEITLVSD